jgi:hypothetical protein
MAEGKKKYIEDCARLIDRRVERLEAELSGEAGQAQDDRVIACDRAAIMEAKHLASLIRSLSEGPYRGHPHDVARGRRGWTKPVY